MSTAYPDLSLQLAARIRAAREKLILSQVELADLLEVAPRTLQTWEAGVIPQPRHRRRLLEFLAETEAKAA